MAEFWTEYGQAILSNLGEFSVYFIIVVIFIVGLIKCILPVLNSRASLRKATRRLRHSEDRDIWQDKAFLGKKSVLTVHWSAYLNSRLFANDEYHNASPLDDYINEDTAIYEPGFAKLGDSLPSLMVSLGFLGTMLGIVQGLAGIDLSNADTTLAAISSMIGGMKYAFWTSIVGVVASLMFQVLQRWVQNSTGHALTAFQDAMRTEARVVTVDPLTQITIYQQEQTAQLQAIAEEVTLHMADRLGKTLDMALTPMRESLDNFIMATTQEQLKGVDLIVQKFVQRMDESLSGQFQALGIVLQENCVWYRQTQETLRAAVDGITRMSRDIIEIQQMSESLTSRFDGYLNHLGAAQQQVEDGYGKVAANIKNMELVSRQQANYIAQIGQMQADFMREVNSFQTRMDSFIKAYVENTNLSTGALQKVAAELRKSGEDMKKGGDQLIASHEAFAKGVHQELQQAFGEFDAGVGETLERMNKTISAIGEGMADIPQYMGEASAEYAEQMAQLIEYMKETRKMLDNALNRMNMYGGAQ
ncbi:MAG: MotA/TolQ/ExbB proton channel family protein [Clostridia bacterium]|nr:MotA/TolQ/ExbB proton channel family protein [Clostridia bacterium]